MRPVDTQVSLQEGEGDGSGLRSYEIAFCLGALGVSPSVGQDLGISRVGFST